MVVTSGAAGPGSIELSAGQGLELSAYVGGKSTLQGCSPGAGEELLAMGSAPGECPGDLCGIIDLVRAGFLTWLSCVRHG